MDDKDLLTAIPAELRAQSVRTFGEEGILPTERALGVIWDVHKDAFLFKIKPKELADTRRKDISLTASIFDPIGFLAPFIVRANIFLQSLWKLRQGWDEKVPEEIQMCRLVIMDCHKKIKHEGREHARDELRLLY